jgi:hypothetical protein
MQFGGSPADRLSSLDLPTGVTFGLGMRRMYV